MESNPGVLIVGASFGLFNIVNKVFDRLPVPESALRNTWKWRNTSTSLVHSLITGIWAVLW